MKQISLSRELETLAPVYRDRMPAFSDGFSFTIKTNTALQLSSVMVVPMLLQP